MLCAEKVALIPFRFQEDDERKIQKTLFFQLFLLFASCLFPFWPYRRQGCFFYFAAAGTIAPMSSLPVE